MKSRVLIVSDSKPGHLNQSIAFCKLKNLEYDIVEVEYSKLKKILSYVLDFLLIYVNLFDVKLSSKDYKAVISTGSLTYYINKYLARKLRCKSIAIMLPKGFRYSGFDYILALMHDNAPKLLNIISLPMNLSVNSPKGILQKSEQKAVGIILGGDNSIFKMQKKEIKKVLDEIFSKFPNHLKYIATSRRTPKKIDELLEHYQFDYELIYSKNPNVNPIPDFIEVCDELYISIDSTSMLSEAKANSNGNLNIIYLKSEKTNTKFHKLASNIENIQGRFNYETYLNKVDI